jgi:hypothetical protein
MLYQFWGIPHEKVDQIEKYFPNVKQHIGSVGTFLSNRSQSGDYYEQMAENIVRCAYINTNMESFSGQIQLRSYCDETKHRLHHHGFFGLEILIRPSYSMFMDDRLPFDSLTLSLNGHQMATGELCLGRYGQVYALFFREPIPISTDVGVLSGGEMIDDCYHWRLIFNQPHKDFVYNEMEIYWIYGEPHNIPKSVNSTIRVFQYGNTHWQDHMPFQHHCEDQDDGLYTNEFRLDFGGNVAYPICSH